MAVAIDSNPGTSQSANSNTINDYSGFTMGTGVSNPALVALVAWDNTGGITVSSVQWDIAGTPQSLTLITGTTASNGATSSALYGRIGTITAGNKTVRLTLSAAGNSYISLISFSGVDQTGGATSFPNGTTNTGSSTAASVAITSATGNAVVGAGCEATAGTITVDHTTVYNNVAGASVNGWGNEAAGATTVTLGATFTTTTWCYSGTDVKATGSAAPFVSHVYDLPPRGSVYSEWQRWIEPALTTLPIPTVLTQTLRVQRDFPNPRDYQRLVDYTWIQRSITTLPQVTVLTTTLRKQVTDRPDPVYWYRSLESSGLSLKTVTQNPFVQSNWPNPQPISWYKSWEETGNTQLPFPTPFLPLDQSLSPTGPQRLQDYTWIQRFQLTIPFNQNSWPNPQPVVWYQNWSQSLNLFYQSETFPFVQSDYPNPQRITWYKDWSLNLLETTLAPAFQAPFNQFDWPLPRTYQPIDQFWQNNLQLLPKPTPFFQNVDSPLPVVSQPIDATWIQNLSEFLQANTFPFSQTDWKNPYPAYWYRDHNQNLVIYLPVGAQPFSQTDWSLPKTAQPIDQSFWQSLALNLPTPPPPIVILSSGRQLTERDVLRSWMKAIRAKGR